MNLIASIKSYINLVGFVFILGITHIAFAGTPNCKQSGGAYDCAYLLYQKTNFTFFGGGATNPQETASAPTIAEGLPLLIQDMNLKTESPHLVFTLDPALSTCNKMAVYLGLGSWPNQINSTTIKNDGLTPNIDYFCGWAGYWDGVKTRGSKVYASAEIACSKAGYDYYYVQDATPPNSPYYTIGEKYPGTCIKYLNVKITPKQPSTAAKKQPTEDPCLAKAVYPETSRPINIATGFKGLLENDNSNFDIDRLYSSNGSVGNINIGANWQFNFDSRLNLDNAAWVTIFRGDGRYLYFKLINSIWTPDADIADRLTVLAGGGWSYYDASTENTEYFNSNGALTSVSSKSGRITTYIRNTAGNVIAISNELGQQLTIKYRTDIPTVDYLQFPDASRITYGYTTITTPTKTTNLTSVTYPDGKVKTYHYGEAAYVSATPLAGVSNVNLLTGITDENGVRYVTYSYDNKGRAFSEFLAGNVEQNSLVYNVDGSDNPTSTVVTDPLGSSRTYNFTTILGVVKSTGQSQPAGSGCAASAAALTYDVNGNVASRTDFNGNKTTYVYDMARNLETSRTEGLTTAGAATAATRTITTTWHATWRLPLVTNEYTGAVATGTALRTTTKTYDDKGNITSYTEEDPIRGLSRTTATTYTYSTAVPGLILEKAVDGPLSGNIDLIRYYYYPHDATCAESAAEPIIDPITLNSPLNYGCRGQLERIIDKTGLTTSYDRYNHHGQVEMWTDANAVYNTYSYDLRQRRTRITVENEETAFIYDDAGLLKKTTFADGSALNYTYDNAHRLIEISNNLGDKVIYTLDDNGNRTNEEMFNGSGTLTKSIARQFDALNRAHTVTGE